MLLFIKDVFENVGVSADGKVIVRALCDGVMLVRP